MLGQWKDGMVEKQKVKAEVKECHSESFAAVILKVRSD